MGQPISRVINTSITNYVRGEEVNILRKRALTALLKDRGRIEKNVSGRDYQWEVRYNALRPTPYADGDPIAFSPVDEWKYAKIEWRALNMPDKVTKAERLANRGREQIINLFDTRAKNRLENMSEFFNEELYVNGYAAGNQKRILGIGSFLASPTLVAGNGFGNPSTTYAGISCVPGAYNGNWESPTGLAWPNGRGDPRYDFWSPICVDYGSTRYSSTATWAANCSAAMAAGLIECQKNMGGGKTMIDLIMMDRALYLQWINTLRPEERILAQRGADKSSLVRLGFTSVTNLDGCDVTWEYGIPAGAAYGLSIDNMTILSQQDDLFVVTGPDEDPRTKSWLWAVDFFGNLKCNPRNFITFNNLTSP